MLEPVEPDLELALEHDDALELDVEFELDEELALDDELELELELDDELEPDDVPVDPAELVELTELEYELDDELVEAATDPLEEPADVEPAGASPEHAASTTRGRQRRIARM